MENKNLPTITTQFETQEQIKATSVTWPADPAQSAPSAEQLSAERFWTLHYEEEATIERCAQIADAEYGIAVECKNRAGATIAKKLAAAIRSMGDAK